MNTGRNNRIFRICFEFLLCYTCDFTFRERKMSKRNIFLLVRQYHVVYYLRKSDINSGGENSCKLSDSVSNKSYKSEIHDAEESAKEKRVMYVNIDSLSRNNL